MMLFLNSTGIIASVHKCRSVLNIESIVFPSGSTISDSKLKNIQWSYSINVYYLVEGLGIVRSEAKE